jgi:hypothetical protein
VSLDRGTVSKARRTISDAVKSKAYWFKRMYGAKITGTITMRVFFDSTGEARDAAMVSTTLSDSSCATAIAYSCRYWNIDDADFPSHRTVVTVSFPFDPSTAEIPPWKYAPEFKCDEPQASTSRSAGIWDRGTKTCLFVQIPSSSSAGKPFNTFGNTEWNLFQEEIARNLCLKSALWDRPDSSVYCSLDGFFHGRTDSLLESAPDLPSSIKTELSQAGYVRLVAWYDHGGQNTGPGGMTVGTGGSGGYVSSNGMYHGGSGGGITMTVPTRNAEQSVTAAVYDVQTGKCLCIKRRNEVDFSLAQVIEKMVKKIFWDLRHAK